MFGTPYIGQYFIFLHNVADINPVKIQFKDHEARLKGKETPSIWHERVYLSPTLLQRKWLDYKHRDRFIPSVKYDNILPLEMDYPFLQKLGEETTIRIRSTDKTYRNVYISIYNSAGEKVFRKELKRILLRSEETVSYTTKLPGIYTILFSTAEHTFKKTSLLYYRNRIVITYSDRENEEYKKFLSILEKKGVASIIIITN